MIRTNLETPLLLPGDKIRDFRDPTKIFRMVARIAHLDNEQITIREVGNDRNERSFMAIDELSHFKLVASAIRN